MISSPPVLRLSFVSVDKIMAEVFASQFSLVYNLHVPRDLYPHQLFTGTFDSISVAEVHKKLTGLYVNSSMRPDGLHL